VAQYVKPYSKRKNSGIYVFDHEAQVFDSEGTQTRGTESAPDEANLERRSENYGLFAVGIYFKAKTRLN